MKCFAKQKVNKPITEYQLRKHNAKIMWECFTYVLGLAAMALDSQGATKVQIQGVINGILEQYDCLTAGTITMDDIHNYLEEYGIKVEGDTICADETEYDNQIELLKLEGME